MVGQICVLGGGIIGISTATVLQKQLGHLYQVTLISEHVATSNTSYGAGGFWKPYAVGKTPEADINKWGSDTLSYLVDLARTSEAGRAGVQLVTANQLWTAHTEHPPWSSVVPSFRDMTEVELLAQRGTFASGWVYTSAVCEGRKYMPWLLARFQAAGGSVVSDRKVTSLAQLTDYDLVVNCTGLGAAELVQDDEMYPVRGQVGPAMGDVIVGA
jgi:glycine/D-amino acid oxidase-like deaminating enzyme